MCFFRGQNERKEREKWEFSRPCRPVPYMTQEAVDPKKNVAGCHVSLCSRGGKRESRCQVQTGSQVTSVRSESGPPPSTLMNHEALTLKSQKTEADLKVQGATSASTDAE